MATPLLTKQQQLFLKTKNAIAIFDTGTVAAAYGREIIAPALKYDVPQYDVNPSGPFLDHTRSAAGSRSAELQFQVIGRTNGTSGVAPRLGVFLQTCGYTESVEAGTAAIGSTVKSPISTGAGVAPAIAGTYTGDKSGKLYIEITAVTSNTSITVQATFYPADGSAPSSASFTQNASAAVSLTAIATGVTFDFGDPSSSTTGYVVGDLYITSLVGDTDTRTVYTPANTNATWADIALNQDGRDNHLSNGVGTFTVSGNRADNVLVFSFTYKLEASSFIDEALITSGVPYDGDGPIMFNGTDPEFAENDIECISTFTFDAGVQTALQQCAQSPGGFDGAFFFDRTPTIVVDPASVVWSSKNWFTDLMANTVQPFSITFGSTPGSMMTISAQTAKVVNVEMSDRDGQMVDQITLQLARPEYESGGDYTSHQIIFH